MLVKNQRVVFLLLSVGLYLLSLTQTALPGYLGWEVLLFGWLGIFQTIANTTWIANVTLLASWIANITSERVVAVSLSVITVVVAAVFLVCKNIIMGEDGTLRPIEGYFLGYWLWLASMITALVSALLKASPDKPNNAFKADVAKATRP